MRSRAWEELGRLLKAEGADTPAVINAMEQLMSASGLDEARQQAIRPRLDPLWVALKQYVRTGQPPSGQVDCPFTRAEWGAMFQAEVVTGLPPDTGALTLFERALRVAASQVGTLEWPPFSNSGGPIPDYLAHAQASTGAQWCMAMVVWCMDRAAKDAGKSSPLKTTASCEQQWTHDHTTAIRKVSAQQARQQPRLIVPGAIFIHLYGGGHGHTGFVQSVDTESHLMRTIEGNANPLGLDRVGMGCYQLQRRSLDDRALTGFLVPSSDSSLGD